MLDIIIIAVDKLKEESNITMAAKYLKFLKPYARVDIKEIKAVPFRPGKKDVARTNEARKILECLDKVDDAFIIALDERGKEYDSQEFSEFVNKIVRPIVFIIGGPAGLDESILKRSHSRLSLSRLTFVHEMARVILLEQLFRAVAIEKGKAYHY